MWKLLSQQPELRYSPVSAMHHSDLLGVRFQRELVLGYAPRSQNHRRTSTQR